MDPLNAIEKLAAAARREAAPMPDVTARVLARIRRVERVRTLPLAVVAALSAAAATVVVAFALEAWAAWSDPLVGLFQFSTAVMQ